MGRRIMRNHCMVTPFRKLRYPGGWPASIDTGERISKEIGRLGIVPAGLFHFLSIILRDNG